AVNGHAGGRRRRRVAGGGGERGRVRAPSRPAVFHHRQRGEQGADLVRQLGVADGVFVVRRLFAAAVARDELLGQFFHQRGIASAAPHWVIPILCPGLSEP